MILSSDAMKGFRNLSIIVGDAISSSYDMHPLNVDKTVISLREILLIVKPYWDKHGA